MKTLVCFGVQAHNFEFTISAFPIYIAVLVLKQIVADCSLFVQLT